MIEQTQSEKNIKRLDELLKSQVVYDHMLSLMGVQLVRRLPVERYTRTAYDKTRPEIQLKDGSISQQLALQIQAREKEELTYLLKSSNLLRHQAIMQAVIDYAVHVRAADFEQNLKNITPSRQYCCGARQRVKVPADKLREYTY